MDKNIVGLLLLFVLSVTIFISVVIFNKPLSSLIRATEDVSPSQNQSLIFAWPLSVKADGVSQSAVTVFIRSATSKPVPEKTVTLETTMGNIKEVQNTTDKTGKASFTVSSTTPGIAQLSASVEGASLVQQVSIKFE